MVYKYVLKMNTKWYFENDQKFKQENWTFMDGNRRIEVLASNEEEATELFVKRVENYISSKSVYKHHFYYNPYEKIIKVWILPDCKTSIRIVEPKLLVDISNINVINMGPAEDMEEEEI